MQVSVHHPCSVSHNRMTTVAQGNYCAECKLIVVDFTDMSNDEIIGYLLARKDEKTCGTFRNGQVKAPLKNRLLQPLRYMALLTIGLFSAKTVDASCSFESKAFAPFKTDMIATKGDSIVWRITGRITDRKSGNGIRHARINVQHNDTKAGEEEFVETEVDENGYFELIIPAADTDETFTFYVSGPDYNLATIKNLNPASGKLDVRLKKNYKAAARHAKYACYTTGCPSF